MELTHIYLCSEITKIDIDKFGLRFIKIEKKIAANMEFSTMSSYKIYLQLKSPIFITNP